MRLSEARRCVQRGAPIDLAQLAGEHWQGWTLHAGLLHHPNWRRGFQGNELAAMWFQCQLVRSLELQVRTLTHEVAHQQEQIEAAEQRAWWYRRQLSLESSLGMMLARLDG